MREAHQHDEIELNVVRTGEISYLFGGEPVTLHANELLLFWGARPHRLVACAPGTRFFVLTLPLGTFLRFGLPERLTGPVLRGEPVVAPLTPGDPARLDTWLGDPDDPEARRVLELELEARLRRLDRALRDLPQPTPRERAAPSGRLARAAGLARLIAHRYTDPDVRLTDLAREAGLHPNSAATLFRDTFGSTMGEALTRYRVSHAQRLLLTTDLPVLDVAAESGFGSPSQFYAAFRTACRLTPLAYRRRARAH